MQAPCAQPQQQQPCCVPCSTSTTEQQIVDVVRQVEHVRYQDVPTTVETIRNVTVQVPQEICVTQTQEVRVTVPVEKVVEVPVPQVVHRVCLLCVQGKEGRNGAW